MHTTPISLLMRLKQPQADTAWQRLVELYTPLLFSWARRAGMRPPDDADLVQDVFAVLVKKLPEFEYDPGKSFRSWLRTVVLNRWRDLQRRKVAAKGNPGEFDIVELPDPDGDGDFWQREHHQQLAAHALRIMQAEFEESTWKACWETVVLGKPVADVAAALGISRNAVHVAKCRVLRRLKQELSGFLD